MDSLRDLVDLGDLGDLGNLSANFVVMNVNDLSVETGLETGLEM